MKKLSHHEITLLQESSLIKFKLFDRHAFIQTGQRYYLKCRKNAYCLYFNETFWLKNGYRMYMDIAC